MFIKCVSWMLRTARLAFNQRNMLLLGICQAARYCRKKLPGPKLEQEFVLLHNLKTSILTLVCTNPAFEEHIERFLDEEGEAKEFFVEFGAFYDAYIIQRVLATTMMTIVILIIPWLLHCPDFNFPKLIFKAGETSAAGLIFCNDLKRKWRTFARTDWNWS